MLRPEARKQLTVSVFEDDTAPAALSPRTASLSPKRRGLGLGKSDSLRNSVPVPGGGILLNKAGPGGSKTTAAKNKAKGTAGLRFAAHVEAFSPVPQPSSDSASALVTPNAPRTRLAGATPMHAPAAVGGDSEDAAFQSPDLGALLKYDYAYHSDEKATAPLQLQKPTSPGDFTRHYQQEEEQEHEEEESGWSSYNLPSPLV